MANNIGKNTKVGSAAPCWARYIKMVTGSKVNDEAFKTKKSICALLAVVAEGLISCKARMALRPMGVAALSKPKPLAAKFKVIKPSAGCPRGTSGISLANNSSMTSTDSLAILNRLSTIAAHTPGSPPNQRTSPAILATIKKVSHKPFNMQGAPRVNGSFVWSELTALLLFGHPAHRHKHLVGTSFEKQQEHCGLLHPAHHAQVRRNPL